MSPRNKFARGIGRLQKPITGALLVSMLGQPLLAQIPGLPTTPGAPALRPRPPSLPAPVVAANGAAEPAVAAVPPPSPLPLGVPPPVTTNAPVAGALFSGLLTADLPPEMANKLVQLNYLDSPLDMVIASLTEWTGRMIIKAPGLNASVTLKATEKIPVRQALEAIETVLVMNNVGFVKMGDKFLKVVPIANVPPEGGKINFGTPETPYPAADQMINQVVPLKYMEIEEAQPIVQGLLHGYGKITAFPRTNSLLIMDTGANINRILEVLNYIDQPVESKVETRIYTINYAKASDIASRLNELIADTQSKEEKPRIDTTPNPAVPAIPTPPGIIRAPRAPATATANTSGETAAEAAERGVIRGKVKIISDERMNILFIISRVENFAFFDKIITVLDRPTDPEITVRVASLEFAKADEIASVLNEFIGAAKEETGKSSTTAPAAGAGQPAAGDSRSQALRDYVQRQQETRTPAAAAERARLAPVGGEDKNVIGRLSPTTRILADKRTNSLLLMGRRNDLDALEKLIAQLDIMLSQVVIEAVIIEVNLGNTASYGVDWLQRSMTAYNEQRAGPGGGITVRQPVLSFGGGTAGGGGGFADGGLVDRATSLGEGLTYFTTFHDLNLDAVIKMTKTSRDGRILSVPIILTTDNKEASILVGEERPIVNANTYQTTGQQTQNYEYRKIGIELKVTPHINPKGMVGLEIKQTADNVGGFEVINGARVPIITKRELSAEVTVRSSETIVLGGLTGTDKTKSRTGVPILSDIPIIGSLFRTDTHSDTRTELLVLISPYVVKTPEEAREETARLHASSGSSRTRWPEGWTDSPLPRMTDKELQALLEKRRTRVLKAASEADDDLKSGNGRVSASSMDEPAELAPATTNALPAVVAPPVVLPVAPVEAPAAEAKPVVPVEPAPVPVQPAPVAVLPAAPAEPTPAPAAPVDAAAPVPK